MPAQPGRDVPFPVLPLAAGFAVRDSLRKLDAYCKAVLYSLAMRMPNCWPSVERVAHDSGMSVRKAQGVLARLERVGVVRRSRQEGRYGTNVYALDLDALREGCTGVAVTRRHGRLAEVKEKASVHGRFLCRSSKCWIWKENFLS